MMILAILPLWSVAQCSVCSEVVASSARNGSGVGTGINHAILYLMAFPYLIFMAFIVYRYREYIAFRFRLLVQRWRMS